MGTPSKRIYGAHLTPVEVSRRFILPKIKHLVYKYLWVDMFAGEGNLILPILELVPPEKRPGFFEKHVYLYDIQDSMVEKARENAEAYGVPRRIAEKNIEVRDSLANYPSHLLDKGLPVYHVTNPPYLYLGYIRKHREASHLLKYFEGANEGYQDLYQIALINDARHGLERMIYIIPTNFLYGYSVSNKIRLDLLKLYNIRSVVVLEKGVFEETGTNVAICFFERKARPLHGIQRFPGVKLYADGSMVEKIYVLEPQHMYRAGTEFEEFVDKCRAPRPLRVKYYLTIEEVEECPGSWELVLVDANAYSGGSYSRVRVNVCRELYERVKRNILFIRTLDTGTREGRAGLYTVRQVFGADGILVTRAKYRTHPIQLFLEPEIPVEDQLLLKDYFNTLLEYFRELTDSEFMTTYKYSNAEYTRKYLGLLQARRLIETFPLLSLGERDRARLAGLVEEGRGDALVDFVCRVNRGGPVRIKPPHTRLYRRHRSSIR